MISFQEFINEATNGYTAVAIDGKFGTNKKVIEKYLDDVTYDEMVDGIIDEMKSNSNNIEEFEFGISQAFKPNIKLDILALSKNVSIIYLPKQGVCLYTRI